MVATYDDVSFDVCAHFENMQQQRATCENALYYKVTCKAGNRVDEKHMVINRIGVSSERKIWGWSLSTPDALPDNPMGPYET